VLPTCGPCDGAPILKHLIDRIDVVQHDSRRGAVHDGLLDGNQPVPHAPDSSIELVVSGHADTAS
jgi:hypothetical protein